MTSVTPFVPQVSFQVDPHGEWLQVTNNNARPVVILGYLREPYLRVTGRGVEENRVSPTVQLNRSLFVDALPVEQGMQNSGPVWQRVSSKTSVRWHDHRIHWMGAGRPPAVAADPTRPHPVGE